MNSTMAGRAAAGRFRAGAAKDLTLRLGPIEPVLARLDPLLLNPPQLRKNSRT